MGGEVEEEGREERVGGGRGEGGANLTREGKRWVTPTMSTTNVYMAKPEGPEGPEGGSGDMSESCSRQKVVNHS